MHIPFFSSIFWQCSGVRDFVQWILSILGQKCYSCTFQAVQVSHLDIFVRLPKEHWNALARQMNVFVCISTRSKEMSLDIFPWVMLSHESQVASFRSFILLTFYNEKHCLLWVVMRWLVSGRVNPEDSSNAILHLFSPHLPHSQSFIFLDW